MLDPADPSRIWTLPIVGAIALTPVYVLCSGSALSSSVLYLGAAFAGSGTALAWVLVKRMGRGWMLVALGFAAWTLGDLAWDLHDVFGISGVSTNLQNGLYLAAYPFLIAGALMLPLVRRSEVETAVRQLMDALLLFASTFSLLWMFYGDELMGGGALSVAFPTLDLLTLAIVARAVVGTGNWPTAIRILAIALGLMVAADLTWRLQLATDSYALSNWTNTLYMDSYLLAAAAALHPRAHPSPGIDTSHWGDGVKKRLGALAAASVIPGLLLAFGGQRLNDEDAYYVLAGAAFIVPLLALGRAADLVHSLRRLALEAESARARADTIVAASPTAIAVTDRHGIVSVWNAAAERTSGYRAADVIGGPAPIVPADDFEGTAGLLQRALDGEPLHRVAVKLTKPDGEVVDTRVSTAPIGTGDGEIVALWEDVTSERVHAAKLDRLAHHDPLTGLPNRRSFEERLATIPGSPHDSTWVLLLDVDHFKSINDTGGHALGDDVLRELGAALADQLRYGDFFARLSGDEFAALLFDVPHGVATTIADRVIDAARAFRLDWNGRTIDVTVSAGLAQFDATLAAATVLQRADEALYEAKRLGRNRVEDWTATLEPQTGARLWSPIIKDALADDRIELFLQPIVPLQDDDGPATYEALCRLRNPDGLILKAAQFIEASEQLGLTPAIDRRMFERAIALITDTPNVRVFVNLSPSSLTDASLLRWLESEIARLPSASLGIEVTERSALLRPKHAATILTRLIDAGALIAIDDFGIGFNSFHELATLPCQLVKIPVELAIMVGADDVSHAIARSVTDVAHAYGKKVVIEGIETAEADAIARRLSIEYGQGWFYGRPAASEDVTAALTAPVTGSALAAEL